MTRDLAIPREREGDAWEREGEWRVPGCDRYGNLPYVISDGGLTRVSARLQLPCNRDETERDHGRGGFAFSVSVSWKQVYA